jgi:hypothetical protein
MWDMRRREKIMATNTKVIRKRRLASGHLAKLTRCRRRGQRMWHIGVEPGGCPCAAGELKGGGS